MKGSTGLLQKLLFEAFLIWKEVGMNKDAPVTINFSQAGLCLFILLPYVMTRISVHVKMPHPPVGKLNNLFAVHLPLDKCMPRVC